MTVTASGSGTTVDHGYGLTSPQAGEFDEPLVGHLGETNYNQGHPVYACWRVGAGNLATSVDQQLHPIPGLAAHPQLNAFSSLEGSFERIQVFLEYVKATRLTAEPSQ
jgi:hypothetical protein